MIWSIIDKLAVFFHSQSNSDFIKGTNASLLVVLIPFQPTSNKKK